MLTCATNKLPRAVITSFLMLFSFSVMAQEPVNTANREVVFRGVNVIPMDKELGKLEKR